MAIQITTCRIIFHVSEVKETHWLSIDLSTAYQALKHKHPPGKENTFGSTASEKQLQHDTFQYQAFSPVHVCVKLSASKRYNWIGVNDEENSFFAFIGFSVLKKFNTAMF